MAVTADSSTPSLGARPRHLHGLWLSVNPISLWSASGELSPSREKLSCRNRHSPLALSASQNRDPRPRGPWSEIFSRAWLAGPAQFIEPAVNHPVWIGAPSLARTCSSRHALTTARPYG